MPVHVIQRRNGTRRDARSIATAAKISRRTFLLGCLAGCSQFVRTAGPRPRPEVTWALLSDTHISDSPEAVVRGECMAKNLARIVDEIGAFAPEHVLVNGDIAFSHGEVGDYGCFRRIAAPLFDCGASIHMTLGNHDHRDRFVAALSPARDLTVSDKLVSARDIGGTQWILLDSLLTVNGLRGSLGESQRNWLRAQIDAAELPSVICVHHNPEASLVGLVDVGEFLDIVLPRRKAKLVIFGHTHEFRVWSAEGLHFLNLPATSYPFKPGVSTGWAFATMRAGGARVEFFSKPAPRGDRRVEVELAWRADD